MNKIVLFLYIILQCGSAWSQFPDISATLTDKSPKGYYFVSDDDWLILLNQKAQPIFYQEGKQLSNFALHPNGVMSFASGREFFIMDSTFQVVDSLHCGNGVATNYHELRILPNKHFVLLGTDSIGMDLSQCAFGKLRPEIGLTPVKYSVIQELDTDKKVVFEWKAKDHFELNDVDTFFLKGLTVFDWTHSNSIDIDFDGNFLLSSRNLNEITKINRSTGAVMWRFGGKQNQFKMMNSPVPFYGQHDVRRIPNGHLTLFDNGYHTHSHGARAMEFELDEKKLTATLKWTYTFDSTLFSTRQGNVQRIDNEQTLINLGNTIEKSASFIVVSNSKSITTQVSGFRSYRTLFYPKLPWFFKQSIITSKDSLGLTYLKAEIGHDSYRWNTGDSTQIIEAKNPGEYYVYLSNGNGGYVRSESFFLKKESSVIRKSSAIIRKNE